MRPSSRAILYAVFVGSLFVGGLWWLFPFMSWTMGLILWLLAIGTAYPKFLQIEAHTKVADGD